MFQILQAADQVQVIQLRTLGMGLVESGTQDCGLAGSLKTSSNQGDVVARVSMSL
jgi:hypothetical protein